MVEILSAIACSLITIVIIKVFSKLFPAKLFAATILVAIAFIYVGFSLKDNPVRLIILEILMAMIFYFIALIGYRKYPALLAYGIILHGVWDILHHHSAIIPTYIPSYWPLFCIVVDIITGIYFLMVFSAEKKIGFRNENFSPSI